MIMGQFLLFVIGCLVGLFWVALFVTYRQRKVCDDGWEFVALVIANMLTTARNVWDGLRYLAIIVWAFLVGVVNRVRSASKRLQEKVTK